LTSKKKQFLTWKPGSAGFIFVPSRNSNAEELNRQYYVAEVDGKGKIRVREGPMTWNEARTIVLQLALREGKNAFLAPEGGRLENYRAYGYLHLGPEERALEKRESPPEVETPAPPKDIAEGSGRSPVRERGRGTSNETPSAGAFDALFEKWAEEALQRADFPAEKPNQGDRIPVIVKRKVAQLCEMGICFPDSEPAGFRIRDSKGGEGGPYNRFTYGRKQKKIYPNYEYLVQIAAFRDLMVEYGYDPQWMKFEYKEYGAAAIFIDIGIKLPWGPKIFVEVKETKSQWQSLILEVEVIGSRGVILTEPDRRNDPLRKAKYIVAGRPDFFAGYSPEGFDSYRVIYEPKGRFQLEPAPLPKGNADVCSLSGPGPARVEASGKVGFVKELLGFLQQGMEAPGKIFQFLESRKKCSGCPSRCLELKPYFSSENPWGDGLNPFWEWARKWAPDVSKEWPIQAVFLNSLVAQFLLSRGYSEARIDQSLRVEFTGGGRKKDFVPPCILRKSPSDSICIGKKFQGRYLCCDFLLLPPFPAVVAEVKLAVPGAAARIFKNFREDLLKCREWLAGDASPYIQQRFGIARFEYALAILIDLSGGAELRNFWKADIDEEDFLRRGIFPRLISPGMALRPPGSVTLPKEAAPPLPDGRQHPEEKLSSRRRIIVRPPHNPGMDAERIKKDLETALEAVLRCEETGAQQGVEVSLASWDEVQRFRAKVVRHIQEYNAAAANPIRHASPWAWRTESMGIPLTENGRKYGVELRCSFFPKGNKLW